MLQVVSTLLTSLKSRQLGTAQHGSRRFKIHFGTHTRELLKMGLVRPIAPWAPPLPMLQCAAPLPVLRRVADAMATGMRDGFAADGASELKMIPGHVYSLPAGNETGLFYALDLGGTNFWVLRVQLGGKDKRVIVTEFEQVSIPEEIMHGTTEELFDFITGGLSQFIAKENDRFYLPKGKEGDRIYILLPGDW